VLHQEVLGIFEFPPWIVQRDISRSEGGASGENVFRPPTIFAIDLKNVSTPVRATFTKLHS
jgi:hypothetical protein